MKKKGLVYRMTMILGLTIVIGQFGGELAYQKYFKKDREQEIKAQKELDEKKGRYDEEDQLNKDLEADTEKQRAGFFSSWSENRKKRLEKIKQSKERPTAPLLEELKEKPGYKEIKTRKLVVRD